MLLHYHDPSQKSVIQIDASSRGSGAALIQEDKSKAFASKSLTETEQHYANIERELLAVVFAHTFTDMHSKLRVTASPWEWSALRT